MISSGHLLVMTSITLFGILTHLLTFDSRSTHIRITQARQHSSQLLCPLDHSISIPFDKSQLVTRSPSLLSNARCFHTRLSFPHNHLVQADAARTFLQNQE